MQFHDTEPIELPLLWSFVGEKLGKPPKSIDSPKMWASYHKIYVIVDANNKTWYLRVARPALPKAKTMNEVACIEWSRKYTTGPIPQILAWSADCTEIGFEYVLMEGLPGHDLVKLKHADMNKVVDQCASLFVEMAQHPFEKIGGLVIDENGGFAPGPVIEEVGYEIHETFGGFSYQQLQIGGPFDSFRDYILARLNRDLMIADHLNLVNISAAIRKLIPTVPHGKKRLVLAHQDLHQGNMLYTDKLSGVVDWELACVMPIDYWVKRNTFATIDEQGQKLVPQYKQRFFDQVKLRDEQIWEEASQPDPVIDQLVTIISLTFWIVKCTVTDTQPEDRKNWLKRLDQTIDCYYVLNK